MTLSSQANNILQAAIESVKPEQLIKQQVFLNKNHLHIKEQSFDLSNFDNLYIIGAGKASAAMANTLENILGDNITAGAIVVKYDHTVPCQRIDIHEAGHPVIDKNSLYATDQILTIARNASLNDLVICLISGGGSALLENLPLEISLADLQTTFEKLLSCGANIEEMNAVRKHLSLVKGGQLARAIAPAKCISLIISDVIGDSLQTIASGPTAPDESTFSDAWKVIEQYGLQDEIPASVSLYLNNGKQGKIAETLTADDPTFKKVTNIVLGNNFKALQTARENALKAGFNTMILSSRIQGEAKESARLITDIVREIVESENPIQKPACMLFGGETTVTIQGHGKGGRNQEFVLAALLALESVSQPFVFLSCGTDGTDGPTDAAGALITHETWKRVKKSGLDPEAFLTNNDAYHFFESIQGLIKTGPTGTNVMDIGIVLVND